ncbi:MAG: carbon-nitrogen hydrolase family protein [Paracoccaceae bacterium]
MRVAIWQGHSAAGDVGRALAVLRDLLPAAAAAGADMLVMPELWLPGYNAEDVALCAEALDGPFLTAVGEAARHAGCAVVLGFAERDGERCYNSAVAIGADGRRLAHYRKIQLYGAREARLFSPGADYAVFDHGGRRMALLICYDVEFAPHIRALAEAGVELVLVPTANMDPFMHVPALTVPAQAVNHGLAIAYANYAGTEGDLTYTGGSCLVNADGAVLAQAGRHPALLVADLPAPDAARPSTQQADFRPVG